MLEAAAYHKQSETGIKRISRKAIHGFNLIPFNVMEESSDSLSKSNRSSTVSRDVLVCYTLPIHGAPQLHLHQRVGNRADLNDFEICNRYKIDNTGLVYIKIDMVVLSSSTLYENLGDTDFAPIQRVGNRADLNDFEICNRYKIDNTGLVCRWPTEDVLAYYCLSHADIFRSKKVIELGSGYGLAGLVIAAVTEALEVVISDGNPQVVDYIQHNISANSGAFGGTLVKPMILHWDQREILDNSNTFDVIVASDWIEIDNEVRLVMRALVRPRCLVCTRLDSGISKYQGTFFKEFHKGLARTIKFLLKSKRPSEALFFSPKRGDSLDKFLVEIEKNSLHFTITEIYDTEVWRRHQGFICGNDDWPNYEKDHCYPLLVRIAF
ncbi:Calmodulin-lysine N-methyltransferase [Actinidia chinensis var. chinensis]|uniref:Calmodulin-lysine N-methyltransferase n=1 Tax=Actinidia chinensis var. chinensis TaxID=1590841 RepID=A0A2R6RIU4_ACTCC|nr:Calmodulin-lysine N-methyltransferase [Actinidia chinensis var. chinensis]